MYKATIKAGLDNVIVGGKGPFTAGDVVLLTDEEYAVIRPEAFDGLFAAHPLPLSSTATTDPYA